MIKFYNINTGETREAVTDEQIAAHWASSDRGPNSNKNQDFGWRLAPETVIEMDRLLSSPNELQQVANNNSITLDAVTEYVLLSVISNRDNKETTGETRSTKDFEAEYDDEIRKLRDANTARQEKAVAEEQEKVDPEPKVEDNNTTNTKEQGVNNGKPVNETSGSKASGSKASGSGSKASGK